MTSASKQPARTSSNGAAKRKSVAAVNGAVKRTKADSLAMLVHPALAMDTAPDAPDALAQAQAQGLPAETGAVAPAFLQLLLLMQALGREPDEGWFRATGLTKEQVAELSRRHAGKLIGLRLMCAAMQVLSDEDLAALTRATLVDRLLLASIENDTAALLKLVDKAATVSMRARLGTAARPAAPTEPAAPAPRECSVEEAVAEARLILNALNVEKQLGAEALAQLSEPLQLLEAHEEGSRLQVLGSSKTAEEAASGQPSAAGKTEEASSLQLSASSNTEEQTVAAASRRRTLSAGRDACATSETPPLLDSESWKPEAESSLATGTPIPVAETLAEALAAAPASSGEVRK